MSLKDKQAYDSADDSSTDDSQELTTQIMAICAAWVIGAILLGIAFVAFSDVFAGIIT